MFEIPSKNHDLWQIDMKNPRWADIQELTRCLSAKKIFNASRLYVSYHKSRRTKKMRHQGYPMALSVEPTTACNLRCPECPSGLRSFSRKTGKVTLDTYDTLLDQLSPYLIYLTLYFQGEPFLHPDFLAMVTKASRQKIYTATSTNGHFLAPAICEDIVRSGLSRLIISVDGATQESYESYRKTGNLNTVIRGIKNLVAARKKLNIPRPYLVMQSIAFSTNEHELSELRELSQELEVDEWSLKTAQVYHEHSSDALTRLPKDPRLSRYFVRDSKLHVNNSDDPACWRMWHSAVMTWDGTIVPCCFDKDADLKMGNIHEASFEKIWHSNGYNDLRQSLLKDRSTHKICQNCSEGCKVWINPRELV